MISMHESQCAAFVDPLLRALNWNGTIRQKYEAMPSMAHDQVIDLTGVREILANLGYPSFSVKARANQQQASLVPFVFRDSKGRVTCYTNPDTLPANSTKGTLICFRSIDSDEQEIEQVREMVTSKRLLKRFYPLLARIMLVSLVIGVMALAPTFYNMALYDHILAAGSWKTMPSLLYGVGLALIAELFLRALRNRYLGYFGARIDYLVNHAVFERLLLLPAPFTEKASVSAQMARLRDFESVREYLTSPLAALFFEIPLVLVYLAAMGFIAGSLVLVPIGLFVAYAVLVAAMNGSIREASRVASNSSSKKNEFLLEMLTKLPAIRLSGLDHVWQDRFETLSREATRASFRAGYRAQLLEVLSYVLMTLGAVATLSIGVHHVITQSITVGALIAAMMLVWRIVSPLQVCCASLTRIQQLRASVQQVRKLLTMPPEAAPELGSYAIPLKGQVTFSRVTLRYTMESEPALLGVTFDIKPGQIVAIRGVNGAGKSSILKLILGLYQPQGGAIRLDGVDIRQYNPLTLRQSISYIPQNLDILLGTLRDNLLYAVPEASETDCWQALSDACAADEVRQLPQGLDTVICGDNAVALPFLLQQRINLARAYLKPASLILCDEASQSLSKENDEAFARMIERYRGHTTIMLVTHREDHARLADVIIHVDKGEATVVNNPLYQKDQPRKELTL